MCYEEPLPFNHWWKYWYKCWGTAALSQETSGGKTTGFLILKVMQKSFLHLNKEFLFILAHSIIIGFIYVIHKVEIINTSECVIADAGTDLRARVHVCTSSLQHHSARIDGGWQSKHGLLSVIYLLTLLARRCQLRLLIAAVGANRSSHSAGPLLCRSLAG